MASNTTAALIDPLDEWRLYSKRDLTNEPGVTPEQAAVNRATGKSPRAPRPAKVGILNISDAQLDRMVAAGLIPAPRKIGKRAVRFLGRDLRQWMEQLPAAS